MCKDDRGGETHKQKEARLRAEAKDRRNAVRERRQEAIRRHKDAGNKGYPKKW